MLKIFKIIKENSIKINELSEKLEKLDAENTKLNKVIKDRNIYTAIGLPFIENYDKRIQLFMEARKRGFFDDDKYFTPIDGRWYETAYFKHHYSPIASNYGYDEKTDTLRMSVIGVKGNFSACRVAIYKDGKSAELKTDK